MAIAALATWLVTVGFGFSMLTRWIRRGGLQRGTQRTTHFPPAFVFAHLGLATGGLVVWILHVVTDSTVLAWIRAGRPGRGGDAGRLPRPEVDAGRPGRQVARCPAAAGGPGRAAHPPTPVVLHGILAVSTVVLVLFSALGVGRV